jgi:branched-chain amino acid transport system permease protein
MVVIGGLGSIPGAVLGAVFVRGASFLLPLQLAVFTTGAGLLLVLLAVPGGFGRLLYAARDSLLKRVAVRRGIVVPSLLADVRLVAADELETEHKYAAAEARVAELSAAASRGSPPA